MRKVSLILGILIGVFSLIMVGGFLIGLTGAIELDVARLAIFAGLFVAVITPTTISTVHNDLSEDGRRLR